ncbi:hypothetical protein CEXT_638251 [Caerostris extrusa]|uniref:Uncharacterized protein n=1 Tax=Caerostris extrusa TaxID=172846 RepID=A0AAV4XBA7_CAEEX|nr:hypothetical protein CEXT_638251 [Caerostris extrusa]
MRIDESRYSLSNQQLLIAFASRLLVSQKMILDPVQVKSCRRSTSSSTSAHLQPPSVMPDSPLHHRFHSRHADLMANSFANPSPNVLP